MTRDGAEKTPGDEPRDVPGGDAGDVDPEQTDAAGCTALQPSAESEKRRLEQRQKQIDYGKNTLGYQRYHDAVPRWMRRKAGHGMEPTYPITPDKHRVCSKRAFDGLVRKWRRMLHAWDPPTENMERVLTGKRGPESKVCAGKAESLPSTVQCPGATQTAGADGQEAYAPSGPGTSRLSCMARPWQAGPAHGGSKRARLCAPVLQDLTNTDDWADDIAI